MTALSVNLNKIALMRNARSGPTPGPLARPSVRGAAAACLRAGAQGLTLHPRPDGRHALAADVHALAELVASHPGVELNIEGNPFAEAQEADGYAFPGFLALVEAVRPHQVTLVPDGTAQRTSDHGWVLDEVQSQRLAPIVETLRRQGSRVSLFVDPDPRVAERVAAVGADRIELYTGPYAEAFAEGDAKDVLLAYAETARAAQSVQLGVNAGHDLALDNLGPFLRAVRGIVEVSIGQALVADALHLGLEATVEAYRTAIAEA